MKREKEFKDFLNRNKHHTKYAGYCKNHIEKAFDGRDMDEIISTHQNISEVRKKLEVIEKKKNSIDQYMTALNYYLQFAFGEKSPSVTSVAKSYSVPKSLVVYENSVSILEQDSRLCEFLESEYVKIRKLAKDILRNISIDFNAIFNAIPVYISEKQPTRTYYKDPEFLLGEMKKHCSECKREDCTPPYCYVSEVLWKYEPFTYNIGGEFYDGVEPHIVLYYNNFDNPSVSNQHFLAAIANTLAHEYLHYLHYAFAKEKFSEAKEGLKEALADFFGVLYSINCGDEYALEVAANRYDLWKKREGSGWPYADALWFYRVHGKEMEYSSNYSDYECFGCIGKFVQIFGSTRYPDCAYKDLKRC